MNGTYDIGLVILSIGVAVIASYVALDLASRVASLQGTRAARYWLDGGAVSMGTGVWSMHFIGMLAFRLPIPMSYDIPITLFSLMIAVIVSRFALYTVSHDVLRMNRLLSAGLYMGIGIAAMHYTGMAAMAMEPPIRYDPLLFVLSVLIAIVASMAALWIAFRLRSESILSVFWRKAGGALVMGAAISGMHYTGMVAANFDLNSICTVNPQEINNVWLAGTIGGFTFMFLSTTLLISVFDARLADRSAKLAEALRKANVDLVAHRDELSRANALLERRVAERTLQLDETNRVLERANQMKTDFMANVTHELRTPLNSVIGFAELLKDEVPGPLNAKQAAFAADILASGERLLALVEGILEMSRLNADGAAAKREPVEIGAALEERVAAHRKAAGARGLTMRLEVAADTGSAELDPEALRRMLDALIDNAIKFNREGGTVAVSARRAGGALEIAVADTGIGIARADLAKLFKPLTQLDAGLARRHGGVGLGLALARRLAELHGGTIEVESEPDKGSTFTLSLPLQEKS